MHQIFSYHYSFNPFIRAKPFWIFIIILGERAKDKDKDKHSSTSSVSSKSSVSSVGTTNGGSSGQNGKTDPTWVHDIFEGILTNETRCLCCETVG